MCFQFSMLNISYHSKVGFIPRASGDIFIPFNPLLIWGLKLLKSKEQIKCVEIANGW
jgi:hypothetical protein